VDLGSVAIIALVAGLAGGAMGAVMIGLVQAWMARAKGSRVHRWQAISMPAQEPGIPSPSVGINPFDRFTDHGKRVLALAQDEAIRHNHNYIGTEHLLAALIRDTDSIAARALTSLGIELTKVRTALDFIVGRGDQTTSPSEITLSPRTTPTLTISSGPAKRTSFTPGIRSVGGRPRWLRCAWYRRLDKKKYARGLRV